MPVPRRDGIATRLKCLIPSFSQTQCPWWIYALCICDMTVDETHKREKRSELSTMGVTLKCKLFDAANVTYEAAPELWQQAYSLVINEEPQYDVPRSGRHHLRLLTVQFESTIHDGLLHGSNKFGRSLTIPITSR